MFYHAKPSVRRFARGAQGRWLPFKTDHSQLTLALYSASFKFYTDLFPGLLLKSCEESYPFKSVMGSTGSETTKKTGFYAVELLIAHL